MKPYPSRAASRLVRSVLSSAIIAALCAAVVRAADPPPPIITVSPATLAVELAPYASATRTLTIGNGGGSELAWSLALNSEKARRSYTFAPLATPSGYPLDLPATARPAGAVSALSADLYDLTGLRILWDVSHGQPPLDRVGLFVADLRLRGATVVAHAGPVTAEALAGCHVFWSHEMLNAWTDAELEALAVWVERGGGLLLEGRDDSGGHTALLDALGAGVRCGGPDLSSVLYVRPGLALTEGVALLLTSLAQTGLSQVVPPAAVLANDGAWTPAVASSRAGGGRIVVSGARLFGDGEIGFPYNRRFGHNVIDWLAGALWLEAQPREGTVPPGGTAEVTVTFSAGGLCSRGQTAQAVVTCNDPATPTVAIAASLDVEPLPRLSVLAETIDLAAAYLGTSVSGTVDLMNTGCADLHVSGVTSGSEAFAVASPGAFTLAPDSLLSLVVTFAPVRSGAVGGQLLFVSDDPARPTTVVTLTGTGVAPPVIAVAPSAVAVELPSRAPTTRTVDITNRGKSDLTWSARVTAAATGPEPLPDLLGVRILWDRAHGQADTSIVRSLAAELAARGAELTVSSQPWTPELLARGDVMWTSMPVQSWSATEAAVAADWIRAGGSLLVTSQSSGATCNSLLGSTDAGVSFLYASRDAGVTTDLGPHEATAGIGALHLPGALARLGAGGPSTVTLVRSPAGRIVATGSELGGGRLVVMSEELFRDEPLEQQDNRRFGHQVFTWLGGFGWLGVDPRAGSLPPGATTTLKLTMDPRDRCGAQAAARLVLASNDPATPVVTVATDLNVVGSPDAVFPTAGLAFGAHFLGTTRADSFTIANAGCVDLHVSPALDNDQFTCRPASAFTVPTKSQATVVVTYRPTWPRPVTAALTFTTDDPLEPVATVSLRGLGIEPPVISVTPDSLAVALEPDGTATRTLTITNTGGDDLRWRIGTAASPGAGWPGAGTGPRILLLQTTSNSAVAAALADEGLPYTMANNWNTFNTLLRVAPGWDLVAVESTGAGAWETGLDALADHVEAGGRLIFFDLLVGFYAGHRLADLMGVDVASRLRRSYDVEAAASGAMLVRVPHEVGHVRSTATPLNETGLVATPQPGAAVLAVFSGTAADAAIVRGPRGNTLFHAFAPQYCGADDDGDGVRDVIELIVNEIFALGLGVPWVAATPSAGLVPGGGTLDVSVTWDAARLCDSAYAAGLYVLSNDPRRDIVRIPLSLAVGSAGRARVSPSSLAFGDCQVGDSRTATLAVVNRGCAPLLVTGAAVTPGPFTVTGPTSLAVAAGDSQMVAVSFAPIVTGPSTAVVTITTDDAANPTLSVPVTGAGRLPPIMAVPTDTLAADLPPGGAASLTIALANRGLADLHWTAVVVPRFPARILARSPVFGGPVSDAVPAAAAQPSDKTGAGGEPQHQAPAGDLHTSPPTKFAAPGAATAPAPDLAGVLAVLDAGSAALTALIPDRFDFDEGVAGSYIVDGGQDMYDGGNALYTDRGGPLPYSDGRIVGHAAFGDGGRYVTRKLPGLFVLAADLGGIATFGTAGNLGADGAGQVDGVVLEMTLADGRRFLGLAKRVWGAADPSVNHLVIVEAADGISQSFSPLTDADFHEVAGLAGRTRLYYLLFAAAGGRLVDDQALARIMEAFLGLLEQGTRWLEVAPAGGTLAPGAETDLVVTFTAATMPPGDHLGALVLRGDDPLSPSIEVPARLRVTPGTALPAAVAAGAGRERLRNEPNPFNPRTEVRFALTAPGEVEVLIYDARGLLVRRLSPGRLPAGPVRVPWDGAAAGGQESGSGVYLYRVLLDGRPFGETGKMTLVR